MKSVPSSTVATRTLSAKTSRPGTGIFSMNKSAASTTSEKPTAARGSKPVPSGGQNAALQQGKKAIMAGKKEVNKPTDAQKHSLPGSAQRWMTNPKAEATKSTSDVPLGQKKKAKLRTQALSSSSKMSDKPKPRLQLGVTLPKSASLKEAVGPRLGMSSAKGASQKPASLCPRKPSSGKPAPKKGAKNAQSVSKESPEDLKSTVEEKGGNELGDSCAKKETKKVSGETKLKPCLNILEKPRPMEAIQALAGADETSATFLEENAQPEARRTEVKMKIEELSCERAPDVTNPEVRQSSQNSMGTLSPFETPVTLGERATGSGMLSSDELLNNIDKEQEFFERELLNATPKEQFPLNSTEQIFKWNSQDASARLLSRDVETFFPAEKNEIPLLEKHKMTDEGTLEQQINEEKVNSLLNSAPYLCLSKETIESENETKEAEHLQNLFRESHLSEENTEVLFGVNGSTEDQNFEVREFNQEYPSDERQAVERDVCPSLVPCVESSDMATGAYEEEIQFSEKRMETTKAIPSSNVSKLEHTEGKDCFAHLPVNTEVQKEESNDPLKDTNESIADCSKTSDFERVDSEREVVSLDGLSHSLVTHLINSEYDEGDIHTVLQHGTATKGNMELDSDFSMAQCLLPDPDVQSKIDETSQHLMELITLKPTALVSDVPLELPHKSDAEQILGESPDTPDGIPTSEPSLIGEAGYFLFNEASQPLMELATSKPIALVVQKPMEVPNSYVEESECPKILGGTPINEPLQSDPGLQSEYFQLPLEDSSIAQMLEEHIKPEHQTGDENLSQHQTAEAIDSCSERGTLQSQMLLNEVKQVCHFKLQNLLVETTDVSTTVMQPFENVAPFVENKTEDHVAKYPSASQSPEKGHSKSSTLSGPELEGKSSSETSTPEELKDYDSSSGVESKSEEKLGGSLDHTINQSKCFISPVEDFPVDQDLGIHMEKGDDEAETLPADEMLGDPATEPTVSSEVSEEENFEDEMLVRDSKGLASTVSEVTNKCLASQLAADCKLSTLLSLKEPEMGHSDTADGNACHSDLATLSDAFESPFNLASVNSYGKRLGVFSIENENSFGRSKENLPIELEAETVLPFINVGTNLILKENEVMDLLKTEEHLNQTQDLVSPQEETESDQEFNEHPYICSKEMKQHLLGELDKDIMECSKVATEEKLLEMPDLEYSAHIFSRDMDSNPLRLGESATDCQVAQPPHSTVCETTDSMLAGDHGKQPPPPFLWPLGHSPLSTIYEVEVAEMPDRLEKEKVFQDGLGQQEKKDVMGGMDVRGPRADLVQQLINQSLRFSREESLFHSKGSLNEVELRGLKPRCKNKKLVGAKVSAQTKNQAATFSMLKSTKSKSPSYFKMKSCISGSISQVHF
nr:PREDICTED: uncharacterized protein LOC102364385 [Latimeria chalumnae]|eukprot:XP_014347655.1 PREDICTED: uncharacterized protein LOC102364385 [Latimeria chalumnae]